ncbi:hypothetical protein INR49_003358 [Caranx melampygus]|nr:hypothetical protein INR49_003358 [Caranx melampygus]
MSCVLRDSQSEDVMGSVRRWTVTTMGRGHRRRSPPLTTSTPRSNQPVSPLRPVPLRTTPTSHRRLPD